MMRTILLSGFLCALTALVSQAQNSANGAIFTTSGDMRFLIVVASTATDCPNGNCGTPASIYNINNYFYSDNSTFSANAVDLTLSNYFYQHTRNNPNRAPMRVTAELFPQVVVVNDNQFNNNNAVFTAMKDVNFDYSRFDQRTNGTNNFVNSNLNTAPDKVIDFVVVVWKNTVCSRGCGGYASVGWSQYPLYGMYNIRDGFTITNIGVELKSLFLHEFAHANFNCPHYFGGNALSGKYLNAVTGWGCMGYGMITQTSNAWESWYNGWIELKKTATYDPTARDLENNNHNGIYTLKDFVTTGDAMRIKIPNTNVNLWIENHAFKHPFDKANGWDRDGLNNSIPNKAKPGILMFTEKLSPSRSQIITNALDLNLTNGARVLTRQGNIDFTMTGYKEDWRMWGNYELGIPNKYLTLAHSSGDVTPTSMHNYTSHYVANFPYESQFPTKIVVHRTANNGGEDNNWYSPTCVGEFANAGAEALPVVEVNNQFDFYWHDISFQAGDKIGLANKTMAHNMPYYDACNSRIGNIELNGVSVEVISLDLTNGTAQIKVAFDDVAIDKTQSYIGDVILPDIPNKTPDLELTDYGKLTIRRSKAPNRHLPNADNTFINPSTFQLNANTSMMMHPLTSLTLLSDSRLYCLPGSRINVADGAYIVITENAKACFAEGIGTHVKLLGPSSNLVYKNAIYKNSKVFNNVALSSENVLETITTLGNVNLASNSGTVVLQAEGAIVLKGEVKIVSGSNQSLIARAGSLDMLKCNSSLPTNAIQRLEESPDILEHVSGGCFVHHRTEELSVEDIESTLSNHAYPNPITSGTLHFGRAAHIYTLLDSKGIVVKQGTNSTKVSVEGLSKGIYILKLDNDFEKVIVE